MYYFLVYVSLFSVYQLDRWGSLFRLLSCLYVNDEKKLRYSWAQCLANFKLSFEKYFVHIHIFANHITFVTFQNFTRIRRKFDYKNKGIGSKAKVFVSPKW